MPPFKEEPPAKTRHKNIAPKRTLHLFLPTPFPSRSDAKSVLYSSLNPYTDSLLRDALPDGRQVMNHHEVIQRLLIQHLPCFTIAPTYGFGHTGSLFYTRNHVHT